MGWYGGGSGLERIFVLDDRGRHKFKQILVNEPCAYVAKGKEGGQFEFMTMI